METGRRRRSRRLGPRLSRWEVRRPEEPMKRTGRSRGVKARRGTATRHGSASRTCLNWRCSITCRAMSMIRRDRRRRGRAEQSGARADRGDTLRRLPGHPAPRSRLRRRRDAAGWEEVSAEENIDGLNEEQLETFRQRAIPEPRGVVRDTLELTNDARHDIASTIICTGSTSEQYKDAAKEGCSWLGGPKELRNITWIDLPTSHWPMWSRPEELAEIIEDVAKAHASGSEVRVSGPRPGHAHPSSPDLAGERGVEHRERPARVRLPHQTCRS